MFSLLLSYDIHVACFCSRSFGGHLIYLSLRFLRGLVAVNIMFAERRDISWVIYSCSLLFYECVGVNEELFKSLIFTACLILRAWCALVAFPVIFIHGLG